MLYHDHPLTDAAENTETSYPKFEISEATFLDKITGLEAEHVRSKTALWDMLARVLGLYHVEIKNASVEIRFSNVQALKERCTQQEIRYTTSTAPLTMMLKLIVSDNRQLAAGYALVLNAADLQGQTKDTFVSWLKEAGGIEKVRKTYDASGTLRPIKTLAVPAQHAACGRERLGTNILFSVDALSLVDAELETVTADTMRTAIVMLHADGSLSVRAIVKDKCALDRAYVAFANEFAPDSTSTASDSTTN
ncbi:hypothetical protein [Burkholderia gladioli]|uniref:hypothetical protein n=1 Tax=Burkholderia gladioli TaxID=28095 RepID=UPI00163E3397|nr:hypothetical protein [Burkholderia gladioli]